MKIGILLIASILRWGECAQVFLEPTGSDQVIEVMVEKPAWNNGQVIVLLHGAKDPGWRSLSGPIFDYWLEKGCSVGAISMPGFGESSGTRDFCGPLTMRALHIAVDKIKRELGVSQFVLMGFGQGGLAAALLTAQREDILCTVCSNGICDCFQHRSEGDILFTTLQNKKYDLNINDDAALMARSPIYHIDKIKTPMFILHRMGNPVVREQEAIDFYEAMGAAGKECQLVIKERGIEDDEQKLSFGEVIEACGLWIDQFFRDSSARS